MRIPVHSPWLPVYMNVTQTIVILITAGFFSQTDVIYWVGENVLEMIQYIEIPRIVYIIEYYGESIYKRWR